MKLATLETVALCFLGAVLVGLIGTCGATMVRRNRAFEDACRIVGGVVLRPSRNDGCYKVEPLVVPDYRSR